MKVKPKKLTGKLWINTQFNISQSRENRRDSASFRLYHRAGVFILPQAIRILREYERGVIFRLGKLQGAKGPGIIFLIPARGQDGEDGFARRDH